MQESLRRVDQTESNLISVRDTSNQEAQRILQTIGNQSFFEYDLSTMLAAGVECPKTDIVFNDFIISSAAKAEFRVSPE